jgi:hypothetical protein
MVNNLDSNKIYHLYYLLNLLDMNTSYKWFRIRVLDKIKAFKNLSIINSKMIFKILNKIELITTNLDLIISIISGRISNLILKLKISKEEIF